MVRDMRVKWKNKKFSKMPTLMEVQFKMGKLYVSRRDAKDAEVVKVLEDADIEITSKLTRW